MYNGCFMATGPGSIHTRRVQMTGGATFTVSIPKEWATHHSMKAKDGLKMDWRPSGALRLTPAQERKPQRKEITLDVDSIPVASLVDHLVAAYIASANRIKLVSKEGFSRDQWSRIKRFLRITTGFEIMDENDRLVELLNILNIGEMPIQSSLNRMYLQLTSIIRDIVDVLSGEDESLLDDVEEREREMDAMQLLIQRQVGALLESHKVATELGTDRRSAIEMANLARVFERMGDHAQLFAQLITSTERKPKLNFDEAPLNKLGIWQSSIKALMINIRTEDPHEIHDARMALKEAQINLSEHEGSLWGGRGSATSVLYQFRVSETIRRLCAYARDMGEILLNIIASKNTLLR